MTLPSIHNIQEYITDELSVLYDNQESKSLSYWLLEYLLDVERSKLHDIKNEKFPPDQTVRLNALLTELKKGKPIQYVIGKVYFRNLVLDIDQNVLIPRPETEMLVEHILKHTHKENKSLSGLDIGTGSGCIALSLAYESSIISMSAQDISEPALAVAERNARLNNIDITFFNDDILNPEFDKYNKAGYDFIVSNPPYVLESDKDKMHKNVLEYEPPIALYVTDENALVYYKAIIDFAQNMLKNGGILFLEIHELKGREIINLFSRHQFFKTKILKDLQNKERFIKAIFMDD